MKDYERLTKKVEGQQAEFILTKGENAIEKFKNALNCLAELEDKIEHGTLIELPCKVGDIFFYANQLTGKVERHMVTAIEIGNETMIRTICSRVTACTYIGYFLPSYYGKTIFLTREEAEKRLKELQNG